MISIDVLEEQALLQLLIGKPVLQWLFMMSAHSWAEVGLLGVKSIWSRTLHCSGT